MKSAFSACCIYVVSYCLNSNPIVLNGVTPGRGGLVDDDDPKY